MKARLPFQLSFTILAIFIGLIALALFPHLVGLYWVGVVISALWITYLAVSWIIACRAGAINFLHITFVGIGAYTSTLFFLRLHISPWLGLLAGMVIALAVALIIGWVCFRAQLQPLPFILVTLAFAMIAVFFVNHWALFGRDSGLSIGFTDSNTGNFQWVSKLPYYYLILGMTIFVVIIYKLIDRSKLGIYSKAITDNERGAEAIGIDIMRYKLIALGISAVLAALAGTFWAQYTTYVDPATFLGPQKMITLLIFITIGGMGSNWGPVVAPFIMSLLISLLYYSVNKSGLGIKYYGAAPIIYGTLVILVIMFLPRGVVTWVEEKLRKSTFGMRSRNSS